MAPKSYSRLGNIISKLTILVITGNLMTRYSFLSPDQFAINPSSLYISASLTIFFVLV